jgi:cell division protein ZapE
MGIGRRYRDDIQAGTLQPDAAQEPIVERLDELSRALEGYKPRRSGLLASLLGNGAPEPKGLYIWGGVGRGKSMLMDMFFEGAAIEPKRRVHFHAFMQDVHARLHRARQSGTRDPVMAAAREIAGEGLLLCLDEMQIADIADAMIVGRLFEALFGLGTIIVTTSNLKPTDLYKDGLSRDLFLPFVKLIEDRLSVLPLAGSRDYRLNRIKGLRTFLTPLGPDTAAKIQDLWEKLTDCEHGLPMTLELLGRKLEVPEAARGAARFSFAALCESPLGAPDYLELARVFKLIFIERIPALASADRNAVKRFIILIDTLYDLGARLVASSEKPPAQIYSGNDHRTEFARTASRLEEMQSAGWWGAKIAET